MSSYSMSTVIESGRTKGWSNVGREGKHAKPHMEMRLDPLKSNVDVEGKHAKPHMEMRLDPVKSNVDAERR